MDTKSNVFSRRSALGQLAPLAFGLTVLGCSGGGSGGSGGGSGGGGDFQVNSLNVAANSVWLINREITIEFSDPVDFSSVNLNSVNIRQLGGTPAVGEFSQVNPTTVTFQPVCPLLPDFSDAGLKAGGVLYELRLLGGSAFSVRSVNGVPLSNSEQRLFSTPNTLDPAALFFDTKPGSPPLPLIRAAGSLETHTSYVEFGGNPTSKVFFERQPNGVVTLEGGVDVPLNLQSNPASQVAFFIAFDQSVDPSASNLSSTRLKLQFFMDPAASDPWEDVPVALSLVENCTDTGSLVRLQPLGGLPPGAQLRVFLAPEFRDIVGETNSVNQTDFAPSTAAPAPAVHADSLEEEFLVGGTAPGSNEDLAPPLGLPLAEWGGGELGTAFKFEGTGGPNGDFDFEVKSGQVFVLDTANSILVGGPGFLPTAQQVVTSGVIDVRNFRVVAGGTLRIQGDDPVTLLASGFVQIDGVIEISGSDSKGVSTLDTTNIPEPGATGVAGGGRGGIGSPLTNSSSPKGTNGEGAFHAPDIGGVGGETTFYPGGPSQAGNVAARRGTGGGGGRFGPDQIALTGGLADQTFIGLDAEKGFNNLFVPTPGGVVPVGAVSGQAPPTGGAIGTSPFVDGIATNDFLGAAFDSSNGTMILGELTQPLAGQGGGGAGDAAFSNGGTFPVVPFSIAGDEKGAGGGGGGGSLQILALGKIAFGATGSLKCRGGTGGGGENTNYLDRVGGGSGGASGGHVILQTAAKIDFSKAIATTQVCILATGGQGGAGANNQGGATLGTGGGSLETTATADACPAGFPVGQCLGPISGAGGDGGPGIIQLHTPNGLQLGDILLPPGRTLRDVCKPLPVAASATQRLLPTFGRRSVARSLWIPMGLSGFDPAAVAAPFFKPGTYEFGGVNPVTGEVLATVGVVDLGPALVGPAAIAVAPALPHITTSGRTLVMDASSLVGGAQEYFLNNPGLLKRATVRLSQVGDPSNHERFDVVAATYDPATQTLQVTTSSSDPVLTSFSAPGGVNAEVIPTSFKVKTNGALDSLPQTAAMFLKFQAAPATAGGLPNTAAAFPPTPGSDAAALTAQDLAALSKFRFLRIQVEFDIDRLNLGITPLTPLPSLDFMRLPYRYQ